jgi:hypothetical protein
MSAISIYSCPWSLVVASTTITVTTRAKTVVL